MPSLKALNRKISSLKSTRKITKAMKMIAFTRYRKTHAAAKNSEAYGQELETLAGRLLAAESTNHPLTVKRPVKRVTYLLFTTERGLCGGLNSALLYKAAVAAEKEVKEGRSVHLVFNGRQGQDIFRRRGIPHTSELLVHQPAPAYPRSTEIAADLVARFLEGKTDEVRLFWTECRSIIKLMPTASAFLPVAPAEDAPSGDMTIEPEFNVLLEAVLRERMAFAVHQAWQHSVASEHASRMTAMENATTNAGTLIDETTLERNRLRQAAITKELLEITAGAESLQSA